MDKYLEEYSSEESVRKYTKETAGYGIGYLLENDYGKIYWETFNEHLPEDARHNGVRLLEFGCGGGMNLIQLVMMLERRGVSVESAYGTDFSKMLIDAASKEVKRYLPEEQGKKIRFVVARNESLIQDLSAQTGIKKETLLGSFHMILGINTFRYCHRLKKESECAKHIKNLLVKGGTCVIIDMNNKFPFFRSKIRCRLTMKRDGDSVPSLDEYARPFEDVGLQILRKKIFCWVPHSASRYLCFASRMMTPLLDKIVPLYAMRSLVISRKI